MLHILTMAVRQIMHTEAQQDYLSKKKEIWLLFRFPLFCFLEEKPLDFIFAS